MYDLRRYRYGGCFWKLEGLVKPCRETNVVRTKTSIMFPITPEKTFTSFKWETVHSSKQMLYFSLLAILMMWGKVSTGMRKALTGADLPTGDVSRIRGSWNRRPLCFFFFFFCTPAGIQSGSQAHVSWTSNLRLADIEPLLHASCAKVWETDIYIDVQRVHFNFPPFNQ